MTNPLPLLDENARRAFTLHDRLWQDNLYVYPVVSRRSKGISIGVNLNPDKVCNFDCIYCSVDRTIAPVTRAVDLPRLRAELHAMLELALTGRIYAFDPFDKIPAALRRVNDIAFSGDGEPTTFPEFGAACDIAVQLKMELARQYPEAAGVKIVVITNATMLHRPGVQAALRRLDDGNGEIWGKLDAGTESYYQLVERTSVPYGRVLENLLGAARVRPIVIQSLFMRVHGVAPAVEEIDAYAQRLADIVKAGGGIKLVQIYTVARKTTEAWATALTAQELEDIAQRVREKVAGVPVETYP